MRSSEVSTNVVKCSEGLSIRVSIIIIRYTYIYSWSQWPRGLRRRSAAARLLRSCVRIPPGAWMFVCCECCVLSGRGLCDEPITRSEEFLPTEVRRCVWSRNLKNEEAATRVGSQRHRKKYVYIYIYIYIYLKIKMNIILQCFFASCGVVKV